MPLITQQVSEEQKLKCFRKLNLAGRYQMDSKRKNQQTEGQIFNIPSKQIRIVGGRNRKLEMDENQSDLQRD